MTAREDLLPLLPLTVSLYHALATSYSTEEAMGRFGPLFELVDTSTCLVIDSLIPMLTELMHNLGVVIPHLEPKAGLTTQIILADLRVRITACYTACDLPDPFKEPMDEVQSA